jgi:hypothetical protein
MYQLFGMSGKSGAYGGEVHAGFWWETLRERGHMEDLGLDGRVTLKLVYKKYDSKAWTGLMLLKRGTSGRLLRNGNEPLGSIEVEGMS